MEKENNCTFKREIGVDLLRIIATVFVIILHVLGPSGILEQRDLGITYWTAWFFEIFAYCAVNCFALITGYVMVNKQIKIKNIVTTWLQVAFTSIIFSLLFFVFDPQTISLKQIVVSVIPIIGKQWWYMSSYFALFFFIPFLNAAIKNISRNMFNKFILVILFAICVIDCIMPMDAFLFNNGYSPIWLMVLYLFGAYIKTFNIKEKITAVKSLMGFMVMIVITFLSKAVISYLTQRILHRVVFDGILISYTSITIVFAAVFLFTFCLNIKIGNITYKIIEFLAPTTLGIYLIHTHPLIYTNIIKAKLIPIMDKTLVSMIVALFTLTLVIFIACALIEKIRIFIFKILKVKGFAEFIENKTKKFLTSLQSIKNK